GARILWGIAWEGWSSPDKPRRAQAFSNATPMARVTSGGKAWFFRNGVIDMTEPSQGAGVCPGARNFATGICHEFACGEWPASAGIPLPRYCGSAPAGAWGPEMRQPGCRSCSLRRADLPFYEPP